MQGKYPEWDYYDSIDNMLGYGPSMQPAVVEDFKVQNTQTDDNQLQQTDKATPNLDTFHTAFCGLTNTDLTDTSGEVATTSQARKN